MAKRRDKDGNIIRDSKGNALDEGEYERTGSRKGYIYRWRENGVQSSVSAPTLEELREREKRVKIDRLSGMSTKKQKNTLNDFYAVWLKNKTRTGNVKPNVLSNYAYLYTHFVQNTLGKKKISSIHKSDIIKFYGDLIEDGLAVSTIDSGINTVVRQVFAVAFDDDVIRKNPCDGVMREFKQAEEKEPPRALTDAEEAVFLDAIRGTAWECIFGVALRTGLRVAELSALQWRDIDYEARLIHVRRNFVYYKDNLNKKYKGDKVMERRIQSPKTASGYRNLYLTDEIIDWLELYKKIGNRNTDNIDGETGFIFATRDGRCISQGGLNKALKRIVAQVNSSDGEVTLPSMHMHMLRKTFVTSCIKSGMALPVVGRLAGHSMSDLDTTVNVYTDVQDDMVRDAGKMLEKYNKDKAGTQGTQGGT